MARGKKVLKLRAQAKKFTFKYEGAGAPEGAVGRYYPAEDAAVKKGPVPVRNRSKLRATITPGTVLILLAGRFRGKRVVFLKQLKSGLLLVSGPYNLNGVPLRRISQKYVIATSTKVSVTGVNVSAIDDELFTRAKVAKKEKKAEENVFSVDAAAEVAPKVIDPARKAAQTAIDAALTANINKVELLASYLQAKFTLSKADKPHALLF